MIVEMECYKKHFVLLIYLLIYNFSKNVYIVFFFKSEHETFLNKRIMCTYV